MSTEFWRFGSWPVPAGGIPQLARRLEDLGWDGFAVGEAAIGPDPYICLALASVDTSRLRLGTGVSVPIRHPQLAANAIATLHGISGGRTLISLGRGDGAMHMIGREPITVTAFTEYVDRVQRYLRREGVDLDGFESTLAPLFRVDPSLDISKPPIDVSATGPKVIAMAARLADSITFAVGANVDRLRSLMDHARTARSEAGLDPSTLKLGCHVPVAVTTDSDRAWGRDIIRGAVMTHARFSAYNGVAVEGVSATDAEVGSRAFVKLKETVQAKGGQGNDGTSMYPSDVIDDDFVDRFGVVGTPEECAERLQPIVDLGFDRIVVLTKGVGSDVEEKNAGRFAQEVIPLLTV